MPLVLIDKSSCRAIVESGRTIGGWTDNQLRKSPIWNAMSNVDSRTEQDDRAFLENCSLVVVIVNYRTPELAIGCLRSLAPEIRGLSNVKVAICENGSGDDSADRIRKAIQCEGWTEFARLWEAETNRGFAGGNNVILSRILRLNSKPDHVLLLNSDTIVRPGALEQLLSSANSHPRAGVIGPRLEWPNGDPQISAFRFMSPISEFIHAAATGLLTRLLQRYDVPRPLSDDPQETDWVSFACALIRVDVLERVGPMDEGYFLYFEDPDYCRSVKQAGWQIVYDPTARIVHLRGQSNPLKERARSRLRRPRYWYESRARFFAKHFGRWGLLAANGMWIVGRLISLIRETLRTKSPHICRKEWRDIWIHFLNPLGPGIRQVP